MKKLFKFSALIAALALAAPIGCIKKTDTVNPASMLPNISDFHLPGNLSLVAGLAANITINSSSLGTGTFKVHYNLTGLNVGSALTAVLNIANNVGTFSTIKLDNEGASTLVITGIENASGYLSPLTSGNTMTITTTPTSTGADSTGLVTATINGTDEFRATDVTTTLTGSLLSIHAVHWDPLQTITLYIDHYAHNTGPVYFNETNMTGFEGSASISAGVTGLAHHGVITITTTTPTLTGTFSFTTTDSSRVTGTFSGPAR